MNGRRNIFTVVGEFGVDADVADREVGWVDNGAVSSDAGAGCANRRSFAE